MTCPILLNHNVAGLLITAFCNEIKILNDSLQLQKDLKLLENWAEEWGMKFDAKKCYIISTEREVSLFSTP